MKSIILILLFTISSLVVAQTNYDQTVYLKNGSIINGIIIEEVPNVKIKIQTKDGSVFEYNYSDIEKITKQAPQTPPPSQKLNNYNQQTPSTTPTNSQTFTPTESPAPKVVKPDMNDYFKKSFTSITELGASFDGLASATFGDPSKGVAIFALNEVIGKRTSPHFSIGFGFGVEVGKPYSKDYSYFFDGEKIVIVPITFDMRAYFGKKRVAPFLNIAPGYALYHVIGDNAHTFISNIGLGILIKITPKINVSLNGGYRLTLYPDADNEVFHGGFLRFGFVI